MNIKRVNLNEEGLNVFFGPLEAKIMDLIWRKGGYTTKEMQVSLNEDHPISFNAVNTVLTRLVEKGYLHKHKSGSGRERSSVYTPVQNREEFILEQTRSITHGLMHEFKEYVVPHMLDALEEADQDLISKLEDKISKLKKRSST